MKKYLVLSLLFLISSIHACEDLIERQVTVRSDQRLKIKFVKTLDQDEVLMNGRGRILFENNNPEFDVDYYTVTGSYHSGWFQLGAIVDPNNCSVLKQFYVAAE